MAQRTNIMRISRPYDGIYRLSRKHQDNEMNFSCYDYGDEIGKKGLGNITSCKIYTIAFDRS